MAKAAKAEDLASASCRAEWAASQRQNSAPAARADMAALAASAAGAAAGRGAEVAAAAIPGEAEAVPAEVAAGPSTQVRGCVDSGVHVFFHVLFYFILCCPV